MTVEPCKNCNEELRAEWILCPACGLIQNCPSCKASVEKDWVACPSCALELKQPPMAAKEKSEAALRTLKQINLFQSEIELLSRPFYERLADSLPIKNWLVWLLLGQMITLIHYILASDRGVNVFDDFSWFLGVMIGVTMALVDQATKNLRKPFPIMFDIVDEGAAEFGQWFSDTLSQGLKDRYMLSYGIIFGSVNAALGHLYGVWYEDPILIASITVQWFLIGFAGGLGLRGGVVIINQTRRFGQKKLIFNSGSIDGCGGASYLGRKILIDAIFYFFVGLMIACYVLSSPWENANDPTIQYMLYSWVAFPYICTFALFFLPINNIHAKLAQFKESHQDVLRARRKGLYLDLASHKGAPPLMEDSQRENALKNLKEVVSELRQVSQMSTWPYNSRNLTQFSATLLIPILLWFLENGGELLSIVS